MHKRLNFNLISYFFLSVKIDRVYHFMNNYFYVRLYNNHSASNLKEIFKNPI